MIVRNMRTDSLHFGPLDLAELPARATRSPFYKAVLEFSTDKSDRSSQFPDLQNFSKQPKVPARFSLLVEIPKRDGPPLFRPTGPSALTYCEIP